VSQASRERGRGPRRRRGFTLVEVLASLALVAIILPVALKGITLAMGVAGSAARQVEAASLAETALADLLVTGALQNGDMTGDFGSDRPGYRWTAQVQDWEGTTLQMVEVQVTWTRRGKERSVALTGLIYTGSP